MSRKRRLKRMTVQSREPLLPEFNVPLKQTGKGRNNFYIFFVSFLNANSYLQEKASFHIVFQIKFQDIFHIFFNDDYVMIDISIIVTLTEKRNNNMKKKKLLYNL